MFNINDEKNLEDFFNEKEEAPVKRNPFEKIEKKMGILEGSTKMPTKKDMKEVRVAVNDSIAETKELIKEEEFEDKEYIRGKLKLTIERIENQLLTIEESAIIGAEPRIFETYSIMTKTLLEAISKLMDLQKQVATTITNNSLIGGNSGAKTVIEEKVTRKISSSSFNDLINELKGE